MLDLSVVICTFNRASLVEKALVSLSAQTLAASRFEIILIDNNSTDDTARVFERFVRVNPALNAHYFVEKQQGLSHARNRGYQAASGSIVAYLDDDALANPHWCAAIVKAFAQTSTLAAGGPIVPWYDTPPPAWWSDEFEVRTWGNASGFRTFAQAPNGFAGGNMAFRREVIAQYGGFDVNLGMKGNQMGLAEETALFRQMWRDHPQKNWLWYETQMQIEHYTPPRNWQFDYRKQRALKSGQIEAQLQQAKPWQMATWQVFFRLVWKLALYPIRVLFGKGQLKTRQFRAVWSIYYCIGFLSYLTLALSLSRRGDIGKK